MSCTPLVSWQFIFNLCLNHLVYLLHQGASTQLHLQKPLPLLQGHCHCWLLLYLLYQKAQRPMNTFNLSYKYVICMSSHHSCKSNSCFATFQYTGIYPLHSHPQVTSSVGSPHNCSCAYSIYHLQCTLYICYYNIIGLFLFGNCALLC